MTFIVGGKTCCSAYVRNQECKRYIVFMNRITNKYLFGCLLYFRCAIALNFMNSRHKSVLLEWSTAGIVHGASLLWSHYSMFYNRIDLNYIPWVLIVLYVRANSNHYWNSLVDASNINHFDFSQFGHSIEFNLQTFFFFSPCERFCSENLLDCFHWIDCGILSDVSFSYVYLFSSLCIFYALHLWQTYSQFYLPNQRNKKKYGVHIRRTVVPIHYSFRIVILFQNQ